MPHATIPEDIRRFILARIASVPHLEALLLLRAHADLQWDAAALAERLYVSEKVAGAVLADLCRDSLCGPAPDAPARFLYQPASPALAAAVDQLAEWYGRELLEITHLIHSRLERKAQQFADAFKWRKDD
ncbi:hypothetical protein [Massilia sp. CF038]|uniref:hypothetical protein n=1 Tax=Massilia sp. CF038 TaxID=1881045 RepID=UPI00091319B3|nr:hypothetical protein [Massilia sp. CF038]SHG74149.1 hypothetical protein SAMN05428948_1844 [Massilia sp. CF038]